MTDIICAKCHKKLKENNGYYKCLYCKHNFGYLPTDPRAKKEDSSDISR